MQIGICRQVVARGAHTAGWSLQPGLPAEWTPQTRYTYFWMTCTLDGGLRGNALLALESERLQGMRASDVVALLHQWLAASKPLAQRVGDRTATPRRVMRAAEKQLADLSRNS